MIKKPKENYKILKGNVADGVIIQNDMMLTKMEQTSPQLFSLPIHIPQLPYCVLRRF